MRNMRRTAALITAGLFGVTACAGLPTRSLPGTTISLISPTSSRLPTTTATSSSPSTAAPPPVTPSTARTSSTATSSAAVTSTTAGPRLVWSDEFSGAKGATPDPTKWGFQVGAGGWGNNELECYTTVRGNSALDGNGNLVLTAIRQPGHICSDGKATDYTSARLTTQNKFTQEYGRLEMRAKVPTSSGIWPAFWALGDNMPTVDWPQAGEIDVAEVVGKLPSTIHGTVHGPANAGGALEIGRTLDVGQPLSDAFHVYAVDWTPDGLTWSIDGKAYGTVTRTQVEAGGTWVYDHPFYLLLNLAVGGSFPGPPDASATWPQGYAIDYVRVYD